MDRAERAERAAEIPQHLLPEFRAKWVKLSGAREVLEHAARHVQTMEQEYQSSLNVCLRMLGVDPSLNYRVDLETGAIQRVEPETAENGQASASLPVGAERAD